MQAENNCSKSIQNQFIDKDGKVWNMANFYVNSSALVNQDSSSTSMYVKREWDFVPSDDAAGIRETAFSGEKFEENKIDDLDGIVSNMDGMSILEDCALVNQDSSSASMYVKSEFDFVPLDDAAGIRETAFSAKEFEENKNDNLDGIVSHMDDMSILEDGIMKERHQNMLEEDKGPIQDSHFEKSCLRGVYVNYVHLAAKDHKCDLCDYSTCSKDNLKAHVNRVHLRTKYHKCHLCDYGGVERSRVNRHIQNFYLKKLKCYLCKYRAKKIALHYIHNVDKMNF